ncbi:hypothetical protein [Streptomyces sp. NPDC000880]
MPVATARPISLTALQRQHLKQAAWGNKTPHQARTRAQVVLHAAAGAPTRGSPLNETQFILTGAQEVLLKSGMPGCVRHSTPDST